MNTNLQKKIDKLNGELLKLQQQPLKLNNNLLKLQGELLNLQKKQQEYGVERNPTSKYSLTNLILEKQSKIEDIQQQINSIPQMMQFVQEKINSIMADVQKGKEMEDKVDELTAILQGTGLNTGLNNAINSFASFGIGRGGCHRKGHTCRRRKTSKHGKNRKHRKSSKRTMRKRKSMRRK